MDLKVNPDLDNERKNATIDIEQMTEFLGLLHTYGSIEKYRQSKEIREDLVKKIKPLNEENYANLTRSQKYELILKKSFELNEYFEGKYDHADVLNLPVAGAIFGSDKYLFGLHYSAFLVCIDLWSTEEQNKYWTKYMKENCVIGTYIQTELGHGTYLRGLETTATYDKKTQEFILNSPTLTSTKFWPGTAGITSNYGIVMAKLIIDEKDYGMQAFVVQLRTLDTHQKMPNIETGDIGCKFGFESHDNGYVIFRNARIPRMNMLMKFAKVTPDGKFIQDGNALVMYASMLLLRGGISVFITWLLSISTTIAIRYSCVRRQTAADLLTGSGEERKIIEYQTQQYRLFAGLASTYAFTFGSMLFNKSLREIKLATKNFEKISKEDLAQLHAITAGLKACSSINCLKFAQINRLCCGGHGYSASSGLSQIILESDASNSYEGDNIVLLLQTARYLLKCAQNGTSPHAELKSTMSTDQIKSTNAFRPLIKLMDLLKRLYDELINEVSNRMTTLISEKNMSSYDAWNKSSTLLIHVAKVYISIFVNSCNLVAISDNKVSNNQKALLELFELHLLYQICDTYSGDMLRMNIVNGAQMQEFNEQLFSLLPRIRTNAVGFVDAFDWTDSHLGSTLGVYDGNVYERLFEFARNSQFNDKEVHDAYYKYMKPFMLKYQKQTGSKL